jgi:succinate dehydrogenase/fumarate reductase flavoprotein subunit
MPELHEFMEKEDRLIEWPYPIRYDVENEVSADVLVLGGGIAGCHAAINAARKGAKVAVCDTAPIIISGHGGAGVDHWQLACTNPCSKVTPEEMTEAIVETYDGYDVGIKRYIQCKESYDTLLDIEKMGVQVRDISDEFRGAEFRDDKTKLMFCYDYESKYNIRVCGSAMKPCLYNELKRLGVNTFDRVKITSLLTEGGKLGARVVGATGVNVQTGEFYVFKAKATVSCMGNIRNLWVFNTDLKGLGHGTAEPNCTGTSYSVGWNAGAEFALMEKSMASAGGFSYPPYGTGNAANTWYACTMVDANGKEIPWIDRDGRVLKTVSERYRPAPGQKFFLMGGGVVEFDMSDIDNPITYKYRGPRMIPDLAERIQKGEFVPPLYADLPSMPEHERRAIFGLMVGNEGKTRFAIYGNYARAGFDPDKDLLQATASSSMGLMRGGGPPGWLEVGFCSGGGLVIDWDLRSTLEGLYVAGQPMLGGSEHSTAATTGRYAGRKAAEYARTTSESVVDRNQVELEKARVYAPVKRERGIGWKELHAGIARVMQDYCAEIRHESLLNTGLRYLKEIREGEASNVYARNPHELMRVLDCLDRLTCGEMTMHNSLARKASSRLLNFKRADYSAVDPEEWHKFVTIKLDNGKVKVGELPINYWLLPPNAPTYEENYKRHCSL